MPPDRLGLNKNTDVNSALSGNPSALSTNPDGLSINPTPGNEETARAALLNGLPRALAARIGGFGERHPSGEVCNAVVELFSLREWSAEELATVLRETTCSFRATTCKPSRRCSRFNGTGQVHLQ